MPLAARYLDRACEYSNGMLDLDDVKGAILEARWRLWLVWEDGNCVAAGATEIVKNDTCFVWAFGGEKMNEWFPLHTKLEAWAKSVGCTSVQFFGRLGWERVMRPEGYEKRMVVMRKEL